MLKGLRGGAECSRAGSDGGSLLVVVRFQGDGTADVGRSRLCAVRELPGRVAPFGWSLADSSVRLHGVGYVA